MPVETRQVSCTLQISKYSSTYQIIPCRSEHSRPRVERDRSTRPSDMAVDALDRVQSAVRPWCWIVCRALSFWWSGVPHVNATVY